jgi:hypothetical protein
VHFFVVQAFHQSSQFDCHHKHDGFLHGQVVLEVGKHTKDTAHHGVVREWVTVLFHALTVLGELPSSIRGIAWVNVAAHFFLSVVLTM